MWVKLQSSCFFFSSEILRKSPNLEKDSNLSLQSTEVPEKRHASLGKLSSSAQFRTGLLEQPVKV